MVSTPPSEIQHVPFTQPSTPTYLMSPFFTWQVETLAAALQFLTDHRIDLVLLDLNLPDSAGLDTFHALHRKFHSVPIVVLSGMSEESIALEAVRGGAQDYLVKSSFDQANQLNRVIQFALERGKRRSMQSELEAAQKVQESLYPDSAPEIAGFDIAGNAIAAEHVSGDYYDFIPMANDRLGIVVADVAGHGLAPALKMAETRACLHALAHAWKNLEATGNNLCQILKRTNAVLSSPNNSRFTTLFFVLLDPANQSFTYAAAGHRAFLLRSDGSHEELPSTGPVLGLFPNLEITESDPIQIQPGELVFLPTDGIEEARATNGKLFGKERMISELKGHTQKSASAMIEHVFAAAQDFSGENPQLDDMTAVEFRRTAP
jgi:sigma-B regulation protein RsbU (phosphoserine phosphatase)